jgi:integrative and conjugative element protein (TIGR02256 family)
MWAGAFSKHARPLLKNETAAVKIFQSSEDGQVNVTSVIPEPLITESLGEWKILLDEWLLRKLSTLREEGLPNETGGVLLGVIDTEAKQCLIVDVLPSPPDSIEWPNSYIRGCGGLLQKVQAAEEATAGQVNYVGEWHSHPKGCSAKASSLDTQAYAMLKQQRDMECLPTLMLIIGDELQWGFIHMDTIDSENHE